MSEYTNISDHLPSAGVECLVWSDGHPYVAVWHRSMGKGGDFATIHRSKRKTTLTHLPGVTWWKFMSVP